MEPILKNNLESLITKLKNHYENGIHNDKYNTLLTILQTLIKKKLGNIQNEWTIKYDILYKQIYLYYITNKYDLNYTSWSYNGYIAPYISINIEGDSYIQEIYFANLDKDLIDANTNKHNEFIFLPSKIDKNNLHDENYQKKFWKKIEIYLKQEYCLKKYNLKFYFENDFKYYITTEMILDIEKQAKNIVNMMKKDFDTIIKLLSNIKINVNEQITSLIHYNIQYEKINKQYQSKLNTVLVDIINKLTIISKSPKPDTTQLQNLLNYGYILLKNLNEINIKYQNYKNLYQSLFTEIKNSKYKQKYFKYKTKYLYFKKTIINT